MADDFRTTIVKQGYERDPGGLLPKNVDPREYHAYQAVRAELDRPLQVVGAIPAWPQQECRCPDDYRRQLLRDIARHTRDYARVDTKFISDDKLMEMQAKIVADALAQPGRQGRLAEVKTTDRTGRNVSEFVGDTGWFRGMKGPIFATGIVNPKKKTLTRG